MDGVRMISDIINHILSMNGAQGHRSRKPSHAATVSEDSPIQQEMSGEFSRDYFVCV